MAARPFDSSGFQSVVHIAPDTGIIGYVEAGLYADGVSPHDETAPLAQLGPTYVSKGLSDQGKENFVARLCELDVSLLLQRKINPPPTLTANDCILHSPSPISPASL